MSEEDINPFALVPITEDIEEPRQACVLLLDTSHSMKGDRVKELNRGLNIFANELDVDPLARKRVEVAIVTFGGSVKVISDFTQARDFRPPELKAGGGTPMGEAVVTATNMIEARKQSYKESGVGYYRPWIFLITDGEPTDKQKYWADAVAKVHDGDNEEEGNKKFAFYAIGVKGSNFRMLDELSVREPLQLKGLMFRELFQWLSASFGSISGSAVGDAVQLDSPFGWGEAPPR